MKTISYYVEKEVKDKTSYQWNGGFFTYLLESNFKRAVKEAKEIAKKENRKTRVKNWQGKILVIF